MITASQAKYEAVRTPALNYRKMVTFLIESKTEIATKRIQSAIDCGYTSASFELYYDSTSSEQDQIAPSKGGVDMKKAIKEANRVVLKELTNAGYKVSAKRQKTDKYETKKIDVIVSFSFDADKKGKKGKRRK